MYGFLFFVIRTSRGWVQTGQGNIRFPLTIAISRTPSLV